MRSTAPCGADRRSQLEESLQYPDGLLELIGASARKKELDFSHQNAVVNVLIFVFEKAGWHNLKGHGYPFDHVECWPLLTSFDFTKIVRADARPLSHDFAGEVRRLPDGSYSATKKGLTFHLPVTLQAISAG